MFKGKFEDIVLPREGFLRGPFGSALKKSLFVPKSEGAYKVYEQSVVLQKDKSLGEYFISKEYFENNLSRFEVKSGDFLVSCSGVNYGEIYQLKGEIDKGVINQALLRIRINPRIVDEKYFLYYFRTYIKKKITGGTGDSTIPNFPPISVVKDVDIQLPDIETQKIIGRILTEIDNKIDNNNAVNSELESLAKTIYDYWFLQFEFPNEEGKPYKSSGGKMVWNDELKREIPEGWEVKGISEIASLYQPKTISGDEILQNGKYLVYGANGIVGTYNEYNHKNNEIAICCRGASCGDYLMTLPKSWITGNAMVVNISDAKLKEFVFYGLSKEGIAPFISGSAQPQITRTNLENMKLIMPAYELIDKFGKMSVSYRKQIENNAFQCQELTSLRDFLLPMLMNGQVTFKDENY